MEKNARIKKTQEGDGTKKRGSPVDVKSGGRTEKPESVGIRRNSYEKFREVNEEKLKKNDEVQKESGCKIWRKN